MELTYDLTQKDFYDSFVAHRKRSVVSKWGFRLLFGLVFLLPTIGLLTLATDHKTTFVSVVPLFGHWPRSGRLSSGVVPGGLHAPNSCNNLLPEDLER